jgi:pimeloyl-ACP methyl ester carboxylesterase
VLPVLLVAGVVALLLVALAAVAWFGQRHLLYFPSRADLDASVRAARPRGLEPWTDGSGAFLGWRAPHPGGEPVARAIVLHGNAGTALDRTYLRDVLQGPGLPRIEVLLLEYPGYGPRAGSPTEESVVRATVEAIDSVGTGLPVLLVGESLGSAAVALAAAARPGVAGLLLVTPVASVTSLARRHYPIAPSFLVRDSFRADLALPRYGGRVAFLLAGRDEVAPPDLARALFETYPGTKRLWEEPGATHNALRYRVGDPAWEEIVGFLAPGTGP